MTTLLRILYGSLEDPMDDLTAYAMRQFPLAVEMAQDSHDRALILATTVGREARRRGLTTAEVTKWLQGAYGAVWVRMGNLNPGADLKEVLKAMLKAMGT